MSWRKGSRSFGSVKEKKKSFFKHVQNIPETKYIEKFQITFFPDISAAMRICFFVCLHKYKKIANGLSIRVGVWWSRDISSAGYSLLDNTHPMQHRVGVIQKKNFILKKHWFCFVVVTRTKYYFVLHYYFNFILLCSASLVSNWIPLEHACNFSRVFFF